MSFMAVPALGLSGASVASIALSAINAIGTYSAQQAAVAQQEASNAEWMEWQRMLQEDAKQKDADLRTDNYDRLRDYVDEGTEDARREVVDEESDRLGAYLTGEAGAPDERVDALNDNTTRYGTDEYNTYAGGAIADATKEARDQLQALARTAAYGGSYGGLATTRAEQGMDAQNAMDLTNSMRESNKRILEKYQQVQPITYQYVPGIGSSLVSSLSSILGNTGSLGGTATYQAGTIPATPTDLASVMSPAAPLSYGTVSPTGADPYAGVFVGTTPSLSY